jgi:hypothetical protein
MDTCSSLPHPVYKLTLARRYVKIGISPLSGNGQGEPHCLFTPDPPALWRRWSASVASSCRAVARSGGLLRVLREVIEQLVHATATAEVPEGLKHLEAFYARPDQKIIRPPSISAINFGPECSPGVSTYVQPLTRVTRLERISTRTPEYSRPTSRSSE